MNLVREAGCNTISLEEEHQALNRLLPLPNLCQAIQRNPSKSLNLMQAMRLTVKDIQCFGPKARHDFLGRRGSNTFYEPAAEVFLDGRHCSRAYALNAFSLKLPAKLRMFNP